MTQATPKHRQRKRRNGYALVLFVLFVMIFVSMAGLVIGLGFARLSQQQMRTATDAAALEGLRWRDEIPGSIAMREDIVDAFGKRPTDPVDQIAWRDEVRRYLAAEMAERTFRDPDDRLETLGAGPMLDFSGGIPLTDDFRAAETFDIAAAPTYQPVLQPNAGNAPHGDMVKGKYERDAGYPADESRDELADYSRRDFVNSGDDAFLVRMRRTGGADIDNVAGVSSSGPQSPLLFGRWGTLHSGVTVRATSIAAVGATNVSGFPYSLGRAKSVGIADAISGTQGLAPFVLERAFWETATNWTINPDAELATAKITIDADEIQFAGESVGRFFDPDAERMLTIGQIPQTMGQIGQAKSLTVYAPIVEVADTTTAIIGFAFVVLNGSQLERAIDGSELRSQIASGNASATPVGALPADQAELQAIFSSHEALQSPLLVPVLVNRHIGPN